jgi:hypothetical protein
MARRAVSLNLVPHGGWRKRHPSSTSLVIWLYATKRGERLLAVSRSGQSVADAAVQQQPQPVVGEVAEAVPDPLHLLDQQVDGLGRPVGAAIGGVEGRGLGLPRVDDPGRGTSAQELDAFPVIHG